MAETEGLVEEPEPCSIQRKIPSDEFHYDQESTESSNSKVKQLMTKDILCCELLWSLFVAAAKSYRFSSILRPFPPMYRDAEEKNVFALRECISRVPPLMDVADSIWTSLSSDCQDLLAWTLSLGNFTLQLKNKSSEFMHIKDLTGQIMDTPEPSYVYEVIQNQDAEQKFEELRAGRKTFYAYHGSRLDNFFSILHLGLNTHLNKVAVFGEGTYLSSELAVSLLYSQGGEGWNHSALGSRLACVAVCQMIDDPSVKCQVKEGSVTFKKSRAQASKETDSVPEKYFVVQRNDVIRLKYLLIYKETSAHTQVQRTSSYLSWLKSHKFALLLLAYLLLLVAIGLGNSKSTAKSIARFFKSFTS